MKSLALILDGDPNFWLPRLIELLPGLGHIVDRSQIVRLHPVEPGRPHEARWFGISPAVVAMEDGPLVIAAFGAEPPEGSWQFEVALLGLDDHIVTDTDAPTRDELRATLEALPKLNTRSLTFVPGPSDPPSALYGLVYEGRMDLETTNPAQAIGKPLRESLPNGSGDSVLRQFIDDSANLFAELEFNRIREQEGKPTIAVAWPFAGGIRKPAPNLFLRRGVRATLYSSQLPALGLARLVGYRSRSTARYTIPRDVASLGQNVWVWDGNVEPEDEDRLLHFARHTNAVLVERLLVDPELQTFCVVLPPTLEVEGLALKFNPKSIVRSTFPLDERVQGETRIPMVDLEEWMDSWYLESNL